MKIEQIPFNEDASRRIYQDYMKRVSTATSSLSAENMNDIYMEINSHIFEAFQQNSTLPEIDALLNVLERIGAPEEVLKQLVADKKLEQATTTFNPIHVIKALFLNLSNGISYVVFSILYLLLFGFVFLIFAKLVHPADVGMYYKNTSFVVLGHLKESGDPKVKELLGNWFIPVMIAAALFFYVLLTLALKLKKKLTKNKS
ncbi:hypothetical protein [Pedobacter frigidisoli]|uniref:hypothetical protein n=1 Tax=Pedobacter frigidisoli TaxID=2530455 RepID=UPI00292D14E6|nr:hypothetical protein [Pedobacter frigidisoli]